MWSRRVASYDKKCNGNKEKFNEVLIELIKANQINVPHYLIMDGVLNRTANKLHKELGVSYNCITTLEKNRLTHNRHLKNGCWSFYIGAAEFFRLLNVYDPYACIVLDTVNSPASVCKYVGFIFKNGYLKKSGSLLVITVTKRTRSGSFMEQYEDMKKKVEMYACECGFKCVEVCEISQLRVMSVYYVME